MNLVKVCTQSKVAVRKETPSTPLLLAEEGKGLRRVKRVQLVQIFLNDHRVKSPPIRVDMPTDAYSGRLGHKRIPHRTRTHAHRGMVRMLVESRPLSGELTSHAAG